MCYSIYIERGDIMVLLAIFIAVASAIWSIIQALPDILCWLGFLFILGFIIWGIVKVIKAIVQACHWVKELLEL